MHHFLLLYSRCLLDQCIFQLGGVYTASESWTEIPVGLNPQCSHPVGTKGIKHTSIKETKLSTQYKQKFYWLTGSFLKLVLDGSYNDPSLLAQKLLKPCCQEHSEIQESRTLLI